VAFKDYKFEWNWVGLVRMVAIGTSGLRVETMIRCESRARGLIRGVCRDVEVEMEEGRVLKVKLGNKNVEEVL
jgi:hypothetical protein